MFSQQDRQRINTTDTYSWTEDLDPTLREAAIGYLNDLLMISANSPSLSEQEATIRRNLTAQLEKLATSRSSLWIPTLLVTIFVAFIVWQNNVLWEQVAVALAGLGIATYAVLQSRTRRKAGASIFDATIPEVLALVAPNHLERLYCKAVRELFPPEKEQEDILSKELRHEQMVRLNTLLDSGRRLETVRHEIASALENASPEILQTEMVHLRNRQEQATDADTRTAFTQSLTLCAERLRRAEALQVLAGRIEAEQEVVYQAFGAAHSGITALRVSSTRASLQNVEGVPTVAEVAANIGQQTRAVEEAVQEVIGRQ